jgi:hypothetical protein
MVSSFVFFCVAAILLMVPTTDATFNGPLDWVYSATGESCDAACARVSRPCHQDSLRAAKTKAHFNGFAKALIGLTLPDTVFCAYPRAYAPAYDNTAGVSRPYLYNGQASTCGASSPRVDRLCCCTSSSTGCVSLANLPTKNLNVACSSNSECISNNCDSVSKMCLPILALNMECYDNQQCLFNNCNAESKCDKKTDGERCSSSDECLSGAGSCFGDPQVCNT